MNGRDTPEAKRRCDSEPHDQEETRHSLMTSQEENWCDTMSDVSQCSSNRPVSLCVKYNGSEVWSSFRFSEFLENHILIKLTYYHILYCDSTQFSTFLNISPQDNLLAIESEIAALDQETNFDKLQRQFDNNNLSDIFDYDEGRSARHLPRAP